MTLVPVYLFPLPDSCFSCHLRGAKTCPVNLLSCRCDIYTNSWPGEACLQWINRLLLAVLSFDAAKLKYLHLEVQVKGSIF